MPIAIGADHGRLSRAKAYAAGRARASVMATTSSPIRSVLRTKVRNGVSLNRKATCRQTGGSLKMNGLLSAL